MDAVVAVETDLNLIVKEYLLYLGYEETVSAFQEELQSVGKSISSNATLPRNDDQKNEVKYQLLENFEQGQYTAFFDLWNDHVPLSLQETDSECQKLMFNLNIYFAIYPVTSGKKNQGHLESSMKVFKTFLETKGAALSQTTEFLPFYALPFVPDPTSHPSFKPIFSSSWAPELKENLEVFLETAVKSQDTPALYKIYKGKSDELEQEQNNYMKQMSRIQQQLANAELRSSQYIRRYNKLQADYHKLIGIAAELVDSLENAVRGKMVTPEYLQNICIRLFTTSTQDSLDVTKPGTAGSLLRASIATNDLRKDENADRVLYTPTLNYDKVKSHLIGSDDRKKAFLLQALRWRLTQIPAGEDRDAVLRAYIAHDLLGCSLPGQVRDGVLELLHSESEVVKQYTVRFMNALASLSAGRSYLAQNPLLVNALQATLKTEFTMSSLTGENILGTLQKLSLRRRLQTLMIDKDLISWLVSLLEDHDALSDYTLEYSVALLMNLCLRSAGKKRCLKQRSHILRVLSDLLGHENQEIRPYVNGALYSILALPAIREEAKAMLCKEKLEVDNLPGAGMEEILECFLKDENPDMQRQIHFIIRQLNSDDPVATNDPVSDDEDEDDDDEEGDAIDAELDKHELLEPLKGELEGEELLMSEYGVVSKTGASVVLKRKEKLSIGLAADHPLTRPATPGRKLMDAIQEGSPRPSTTTLRPASSEQNRPHTSSGSRSGPRTDCGPLVNTAEELTSANRESPVVPEEETSAASSTVPKLKLPAKSEKLSPFHSRPKIPRTPDPDQIRPRTSSPPPLGRSVSPSRPSSKGSRPGSGSSRRTAGSDQKSR